jgi:hypothetical protein
VKYRNVSSDELFVAHLGRVVAPDEVIDAGDDDLVWAETLWAPVGSKSKTLNKED